MDDVKTMDDFEEKQQLRSFFKTRYRKLVNSFEARYRDMDQMEIEDVVSDLMTDLLARADIESQIENLGAYIYRSVQNRILDYLRRKKKTLSLDKDPDDSGEENSRIRKSMVEPGYNTEAQLDSLEIRSRLIRALDELKPAERVIWIATEIEGYHFRELSEMWGIPLGTLLARKHRANATLQKQLYDLKNF